MADLREAAANPAAEKFEAVLGMCELTSKLVKKIDAMGIDDVASAARSAPPPISVSLVNEVLDGQRERCPACGGWRRKT